MRAFEICWKGLPDCVGIYAAPSAAKAKYACASVLLETGYAPSERDAFVGMTCHRRPDLDVWASQFASLQSRAKEFVCSDLEVRGDRDSS